MKFRLHVSIFGKNMIYNQLNLDRKLKFVMILEPGRTDIIIYIPRSRKDGL